MGAGGEAVPGKASIAHGGCQTHHTCEGIGCLIGQLPSSTLKWAKDFLAKRRFDSQSPPSQEVGLWGGVEKVRLKKGQEVVASRGTRKVPDFIVGYSAFKSLPFVASPCLISLADILSFL